MSIDLTEPFCLVVYCCKLHPRHMEASTNVFVCALLSWIIHAHLVSLSVVKRLSFHFILNQGYIEYELDWKFYRPEQSSILAGWDHLLLDHTAHHLLGLIHRAVDQDSVSYCHVVCRYCDVSVIFMWNVRRPEKEEYLISDIPRIVGGALYRVRIMHRVDVHSPAHAWGNNMHHNLRKLTLWHVHQMRSHISLRISNVCPAGTQYQNDVVSTSMRRDHVASTLIRRHFNVVCPLGAHSAVRSKKLCITIRVFNPYASSEVPTQTNHPRSQVLFLLSVYFKEKNRIVNCTKYGLI